MVLAVFGGKREYTVAFLRVSKVFLSQSLADYFYLCFMNEAQRIQEHFTENRKYEKLWWSYYILDSVIIWCL